MAGTITHSWNGTVLTITSDSGTSSVDLKGTKGDTGPRGAQGKCGVILNPDGTIDTSAYATEDYVDTKIAEVQLGSVDLSDYYTKSETNALIPDVSGFITEIPSEYITETELNAKGYLTEHQSLKTINGESIVGTGDITISGGDVDLTDYYTKEQIDAKGYLTSHQSLAEYAKKSEIPTVPSNVSFFTNDAGYLTLDTLPKYTGGVE